MKTNVVYYATHTLIFLPMEAVCTCLYSVALVLHRIGQPGQSRRCAFSKRELSACKRLELKGGFKKVLQNARTQIYDMFRLQMAATSTPCILRAYSVHTPCIQAAVLVCPSSLVYAASGSRAKKGQAQPLINVAINCGDMW